MTVLNIAGVNLRRMLRDRTNAFFVVIFPMLMVMVLGLAFGGESRPSVAVVLEGDGPLATELAEVLESSSALAVHRVTDRDAAVSDVETGRLTAAVVVPAGYHETLVEGAGATVEYVSRADRWAQQVGMVVRAAVDGQAAQLRVASVLEDRLGTGLGESLALAEETSSTVAPVSVTTTTAGTALFPDDMGQFDLGASSQLLLFTFVTSMTTASALIETRRFGVSRRMFATPNRVSGIVLGEGLGRIAVAVLQGIVIMLGSAAVFGVDWGSPLGAASVMVLFATVAGGAGLLLGAAAKTPQQAIGLGLLAGLGLSGLGGAMTPLELFSPTMQKVAHLTPHAWAGDGFAELVRRDGSVLDIGLELGVLAAYALVLFSLGSWVLRRRILSGD